MDSKSVKTETGLNPSKYEAARKVINLSAGRAKILQEEEAKTKEVIGSTEDGATNSLGKGLRFRSYSS